MEQRLKKERNRLFLRIILIITAVWLSVTLAFCAVTMVVEVEMVKSSGLSGFSQLAQMIMLSNGEFSVMESSFLQSSGLDNTGDKNKLDTQLAIIDIRRFRTVVDTAKSIGLRYNVEIGPDYYPSFFGFLNYDTLRNSMSDRQFNSIKKWLNTERDDKNYYELICTRCQQKDFNIIPTELEIVLVDGYDRRFILQKNIETYKLDVKVDENSEVYTCSDIRTNCIPKGFLLNKEYCEDYMSSLTRKQLRQPIVTVWPGLFEMVFYASDTISLSNTDNETVENEWEICYAKKINIFDNCKPTLAMGTSVIFVFFLTIAVILCLMIWKTVKSQIIQEQKRRGLTDALAHDIKTPLFVISGYAYSLQEDIDSEERDKYLEKILEQTDSINNMVYKMLNLSKLDSYSAELNLSEFDLYKLAAEAAENYVSLPEGKRIKLAHTGDNTVNADKELVKEAIGNLLDNAVSYSPADSVIEIVADGKSLSISNPCDNLTKSDLKSITQPYVRKDKSRHQKGNGLGLSIVKSIFELHKSKYSLKLIDNRLVVKFVLK